MSANRLYVCDCSKYCQPPRQVSKRTYFAHAAHRQARISSALDQFLAERNIDLQARPADIHDHDSDGDVSDNSQDVQGHPAGREDHDVQMHDDFNDIYADAVLLPVDAAQPDDLENIYVDPIQPVEQEDHAPAPEDDLADGVVSHFFIRI